MSFEQFMEYRYYEFLIGIAITGIVSLILGLVVGIKIISIKKKIRRRGISNDTNTAGNYEKGRNIPLYN